MGIGDIWRRYLEWIVGNLGSATALPPGVAFSPTEHVHGSSTKLCCGVFFTKNGNKHEVSLVINGQTNNNTRGCVA